MTETILVIAAHPDDEVLGVGATVARHAAAGDAVHTIIVAEGATSRDAQRNNAARVDELIALRQSAAEAAAILGTSQPILLGLPDNRLDSCDLLDIVKKIEAVVDRVKPSVIYTHHAGDLNVDHQIVHEAVLVACRPLPASPIRAIYAFETVSATEWSPQQTFLPNHFVDAGPTWQKKMAALSIYESEMRPFPHARSLEAVEALAKWRGSSVGLNKAEAFQIIRQLQC
ncbi:MAG: PIG-L family deacetylase [Alphaproteobacteria bacterium]|nr:PIG-L family deacetylase [Alphaproteobacteria bacterium]